MLTTKKAAARIGVASNTLRGWRMTHTGRGFKNIRSGSSFTLSRI